MAPETADPPTLKRELRKRMRALRLIADQKQGPDAARALLDHLLPRLDDVGIAADTIVAGYWPIVTEIDVRPLMARLIDRGIRAALPLIEADGATLAFRAWRPEDDLDAGPRGTMQPRADASRARPAVALVPLLAFDRDGYRLGQGGGYYDRTLAALRREGPLTAIGVGYALQRVDAVPREAHDQPLDWLLTEDALVRVRR